LHRLLGKFFKRINIPVIIYVNTPACDHPGDIAEKPEISILNFAYSRYMTLENKLAYKKYYI